MPPSLSVTGPTPESSPVIEPTTPSKSKGKRKADEVEGPGGTPPEAKKSGHQKTTFATQDPRPHRASGTGTSGSSHAPSSFHRSKRARLSGSATPGSTIASVMSSVGEDGPRPASRSGNHQQNASNTGSWASRASAPYRTQSRTSGRNSLHPQKSRAPSEVSQASIPISALISPHAPSISHRSSTYHMRDPRKPAPVQPTPWSLTLPERGWQRWTDGGGSPLHAWMFFIGFVLFPLWWVAALLVRIPKTREIGMDAEEKGVMLDDPQVEHDAISWRRRCRVMAVVSLFTYIPFIVCIAIFAPR
ncbi:hypothetical protein BDZ89DRAFT_940987 [Hymenopellis radicata]|nr:hypothetical protein BDZ89DRAFT_940987 [Hymenopellis radicata]